ncbi:MAG: sortase [Bellilinea sp.]|nr:MAG: sortase [Bellilinea sp.]
MVNLKTKPLVLIGVVLMFIGIAGSVLSMAELVGVKFASFEDWENKQRDTGFIPLSVPLNMETEYPKSGVPSLPPLPTLPVKTPDPNSLEEANSSTPFAKVSPTPEATRPAVIPTRLIIPSIQLDAPVVPTRSKQTRIGGDIYEQWQAPNKFAVGWYTGSAVLGQTGNTVLVGHHNVEGKVFENLHKVQPGDEIVLAGGTVAFRYQVVNVMILPERDVDVQTRLENARWILPSEDERITLVTCWPAWTNTHRLIVVAQPIGEPFTLPED